MINYLMGLCSSPGLHHPVEITNSAFCHLTYSNLTKVLSFWDLADTEWLKFAASYLPNEAILSSGKPYRLLSHDLTKLVKAHSHCLPGRSYVLLSNAVANKLSLSAGYQISALHTHDLSSSCAPSLLFDRIDIDADKNSVILAQIKQVMTHSDLPFKDILNVFVADAAYGKAAIIAPIYEYKNMVGILRMRTGMKVWTSYTGSQKATGANRIYDEKYYLREGERQVTDKKSGITSAQIGIDALTPDQTDSYPLTLKNGRNVIVELKRWNNMRLRSKGEAKMKDKPIDIVQVIIKDQETNKPLFDRPMFLAVTGTCRAELNCKDVQQNYRHRFDVESSYRFMNQNLLLNKLQSPDITHQDRWLKIVQIAYWLLYTASQEIETIDIPIWQKYLKENKKDDTNDNLKKTATLSQTQKSIHRLFCTFDPKPFLPQKCKKGKGRAIGTIMPKKTKQPILKKGQNNTKTNPKIKQNEN
jgi:hypothetical protein